MLEAACREQDLTRESWGDLSQAKQGALAERIIVDEEHKLLFCPVPLTAIGPWMKVLYYLGPGRELKSLDQVPSRELSNRENFRYLSSYSQGDQEAMVESYLKFVVTRHPFFRLAAAYKMKFESENAFFHERYGKEIVRLYQFSVVLTTRYDTIEISFLRATLSYLKFVVTRHAFFHERYGKEIAPGPRGRRQAAT